MRSAVLLLMCLHLSALCGEAALSGWRNNTTGLYPDATPVLEWSRVSKGVVQSLSISAKKPKGSEVNGAQKLGKGHPRQWLVAGLFPTQNPPSLDAAALPEEASLRPNEGDKAGEGVWKAYESPGENKKFEGGSEFEWADVHAALGGFKPDSIAYAHTYLYAPADAECNLLLNHVAGLKACLNGQEIYKSTEIRMSLVGYTHLGQYRSRLQQLSCPKVALKLKKGWNSLLFKLTTEKTNGWKSVRFLARLEDLADAGYADKNILWAAPLGDRSSGTPLLVGDRIFAMVEPDELACLDKQTGKRLWTRYLDLYHATPAAERDAKPAFKEQVAPLIAQLDGCKTMNERLALRGKIQEALTAINKEKYQLKWDGHMEGHFGIVGWTMPTPCSDGKHVYVYCGNGVAAKYDLEGNPKWIRRANDGMIFYLSTPALIGGKLVIYSGGINTVALNAETGEKAWEQPQVDKNIAALVPARINGVEVVLSREGEIVRASDGKVLYAHSRKHKGDTGWAPPVILDDTVYLLWCGVGSLLVWDFKGQSGEAWQPKEKNLGGWAISKDDSGKWVDKWTCGSPLVHDGICYLQDIYATLYAVDLKTEKMLYRQDLREDLDYLFHYNAVGVAASLTLGGKHIFMLDNQGNCVVFETGPVFKKVAVNRIHGVVQRDLPIGSREQVGYSPPLFEGNRMYLRGERFLYCIGKP